MHHSLPRRARSESGRGCSSSLGRTTGRAGAAGDGQVHGVRMAGSGLTQWRGVLEDRVRPRRRARRRASNCPGQLAQAVEQGEGRPIQVVQRGRSDWFPKESSGGRKESQRTGCEDTSRRRRDCAREMARGVRQAEGTADMRVSNSAGAELETDEGTVAVGCRRRGRLNEDGVPCIDGLRRTQGRGRAQLRV